MRRYRNCSNYGKMKRKRRRKKCLNVSCSFFHLNCFLSALLLFGCKDLIFCVCITIFGYYRIVIRALFMNFNFEKKKIFTSTNVIFCLKITLIYFYMSLSVNITPTLCVLSLTYFIVCIRKVVVIFQ